MRAAVDPFTSVIRTLQYNYEYIASRHACVACISRRTCIYTRRDCVPRYIRSQGVARRVAYGRALLPTAVLGEVSGAAQGAGSGRHTCNI